MVKYSEEQLDGIFGALADTNRRRILAALSQGETTVTRLAELLSISLPGTLKHVGVLERAGLLSHSKDGRVRRCQLDARPMETASQWLAKYEIFWKARLDGLQKFLEENADDGNGNK